MNIDRFRLALLSFVAVGALAGAAVAQDQPPVDPAAAVDPDPGVAIDPVDPDPVDEEADGPAPPEIIPIPAVWAPVPTDAEGRSAYGLYLAGRLAQSRGLGGCRPLLRPCWPVISIWPPACARRVTVFRR